MSWVTVDLSEDPAGGTLLRLEHVAHVSDDWWDRFGPGAVGVGWDQALLGLDQHLTTNASSSPETATEWLSSEQGKRFVRESSDAWGDASMASGTATDLARAAAERTRAFYTGETVESEDG